MSRPQTHEQRLLCEAEQLLSNAAHTHDERLCVLEAVAAAKSNCDITEYWNKFNCSCVQVDSSIISAITHRIEQTGIPFSMAISSLAREPLSVEEQKKNGVFYTDFRLANFMADDCSKRIEKHSSVADFAAGTGILLVGIAEVYKHKYPEHFNAWLAEKLFAFDLSSIALRGARAALLSMTNDITALKKMNYNWKVTDTLLDTDLDKLNVDIVVGNPPWGKIKLTRHNFLSQNGEQRVYGSEYLSFDSEKFEKTKADLIEYSKIIRQKYDLLGNAEPDMYMAFLQRVVSNVAMGGHISYLIPAGLVRSQGTQVLRRYLLENAAQLEFDLLDNHANFFTIDTRFKFLLLSFDKKASSKEDKLKSFFFSIASADSLAVYQGEQVRFDISQLETARPDLTIPEVKSEKEKDLFFKICKNGHSWGVSNDIWLADIVREVDMTNDRKHFVSAFTDDTVPVVEGRMVQQHRFGTKSYLSGSGRSAKWIPCSSGGKSQFYYPRKMLSENLLSRTGKVRAGYCDIAGQTNERAMMSAVIPRNVVCGNKVPTIIFPNDSSGDLIYLWIGITNSFVFDWMIRRIISTTVNYFLLFSIPMPTLSLDSDIAQEIIKKTKQLAVMNGNYYTSDLMGDLRGDIDVLVARAYGLNFKDMSLILSDFPIMDRKQPRIGSEKKSTVTRDLVLSKCEHFFDNVAGTYTYRYEQAKKKDAHAYIPTEMTELTSRGDV